MDDKYFYAISRVTEDYSTSMGYKSYFFCEYIYV